MHFPSVRHPSTLQKGFPLPFCKPTLSLHLLFPKLPKFHIGLSLANKFGMSSLHHKGLLDCSERAPENTVEIMSARNKWATAHAPRSQRTSTRPLPKYRTPNQPVSCCPQTVHAVHSSLWTKGAELKHDVIRLRSLVDVQSKSPYCFRCFCQFTWSNHDIIFKSFLYFYSGLGKGDGRDLYFEVICKNKRIFECRFENALNCQVRCFFPWYCHSNSKFYKLQNNYKIMYAYFNV